ncbi:MAG: hypothetical protein AB9882_04875 [Ignavibacteriaceae bacterium]
MRFSFLFVTVILFCFRLFPQVSVYPFQDKLDSLFITCNIDTSKISKIFLSSDIREQSQFDSKLNNNLACSDYMIFFPQLVNQIPEIEYQLMMMRHLKTFDDYYGFLVDHDISSSLYRVYQDIDGKIVKIEHLSIDINVDFGDLISTSFYKEGKLILYINNHCYRHKNNLIVRKLDYEGWKLISEELITFTGNDYTQETRKY